MRKILRYTLLFFITILFLGIPQNLYAQISPSSTTPVERYFKGKVITVEKEAEKK